MTEPIRNALGTLTMKKLSQVQPADKLYHHWRIQTTRVSPSCGSSFRVVSETQSDKNSVNEDSNANNGY